LEKVKTERGGKGKFGRWGNGGQVQKRVFEEGSGESQKNPTHGQKPEIRLKKLAICWKGQRR